MISEVYNCDCLEYMRSLPDKHFDLCIADPPYGLDKKSTHGRGKLKNRALNRGGIQRWDIKPPQEIFDEIFRISRNQVIWGGNYFPLPPTRCFVCWDKQQVWPNFSQCELAWTSFNKPAKHITIPNRGGLIDKITWHPTSKPIELYAYILDVFAKQGDKIFDPFLGSGSSRIAAYKKGFDFYACELDKEYYEAQEERFRRECLREIKLTNGKVAVQQNLFEL